MKEYTLTNHRLEKQVSIKAIYVDSEIHKYQWSFFGTNNNGMVDLLCAYNQKEWSITDIKYLEK